MITVPEREYWQMQNRLKDLEQKVNLLQDADFRQKLEAAYQLFLYSTPDQTVQEAVSLERGGGKKIIPYIADDFNDPLPEFEAYR